MNTITITNQASIAASIVSPILIKDRHNGGQAEFFGLWEIQNGRFAIDCGERLHCLNEVMIGTETGLIELGTSSIAGVYRPGVGYQGNGMNDIVARHSFDTMEEATAFYLNARRAAFNSRKK